MNRTTALSLSSAIFTIAFASSLSVGVSHAVHGEQNLGWLVWGAIALLGRISTLWLSERAAARAGILLVEAARSEILAKVKESGAAPLLGEAAGARVSQIVDRTSLLSGWASRWSPGSRLAVLTPVVILIAVATQSWVAMLLLAVSVATLPLFLWLTIGETRAVASSQQASLDALSSVFQTRTEHAGLIRAFRAIGREAAIVASASEALRQRTMRVLRIAFLSTAVLEFFSAASIALLAVYIGFKLLGLFPFETGENVTLQEGMMVLILAPEFFAPIRRLSSLHHDRADAVAAASVLGDWLAVHDEARQTLPALRKPPRILFQNVSIAIGSRPAVRGLTFEAAPGCITAISGPSGSGKTSSLLSLLGLARLTVGVVTVDGVPLPPGGSLASSTAYVRQSPWLFEGTLAENLRVGRPDASDEDLHAALDDVGASRLASDQNGGLARQIGRGGQGLSGGERQRIAIARALLRDLFAQRQHHP
ncbi:MAG TPA: ATP-binding cassette domain-containing protein, partial [Hyphomonadaceae bacterium]|nr:ATP-binding cassette domain-containing protein [Hyphomonadaceae bacterium]